MVTAQTLSTLDRSIVAALMVDGRASWRKIAGVLQQPERTVTRRGTALLEEGRVQIRALADPHRTGRGEPFIVSFVLEPAAAWSTGVTIARRADAVTTYLLSGRTQCMADMWCPEARQTQLFLHELPGLPGVTAVDSSPVLQYVSTLTTWDPGILAPAQVAALQPGNLPARWPSFDEPRALSKQDRLLVAALADDGRRTYDELGRMCGVSEQTAARRVDALRQDALLTVRAVVDPRLIGFPVAALMRLNVHPSKIQNVVDLLRHSTNVRYGAVVMGRHDIVLDIRAESKEHLRNLLVAAPWTDLVDSAESSLILTVLKQSEHLDPSLL